MQELKISFVNFFRVVLENFILLLNKYNKTSIVMNDTKSYKRRCFRDARMPTSDIKPNWYKYESATGQ